MAVSAATTSRCAIVLVVTLCLGPATSADSVKFRDPDRSRGRLNIRWVKHAHVGGQGRPMIRHVIHTFEPWIPEDLQRGAAITIGFDADLDGVVDRTIYLRHSDERGLYASWRLRKGFSRSIRVRQATRREVRVTFRQRALGNGVTSYDWYAFTGWQRRRPEPCLPVPYVCEDWYPNGARPSAELVRHEL